MAFTKTVRTFPVLSWFPTFHPIPGHRAPIDRPYPCQLYTYPTLSRRVCIALFNLSFFSAMADPLVCYLVSHGYVSSTNQYFPCGSSVITGASAQACCNAEDYCMDDGICHYTRGGVTNGTGYYMAGCTDPTWKDPACPKQCSKSNRSRMNLPVNLYVSQRPSSDQISSMTARAPSGDVVLAQKIPSTANKIHPSLL